MFIENEVASRFQLRDELSLTISIPKALLIKLLTQQNLLRRLTIFKALFRLKGIQLPYAFSEQHCQQSVFNLLSQSGTNPIYIGLQGRFWKWNPNLRSLTTAQFFLDEKTEETQVIWKFEVQSSGDKCRLKKTLFTRSLSPTAHQRFENYWKLVGRFSRLVRFFLLWSIKTTAEKMSK